MTSAQASRADQIGDKLSRFAVRKIEASDSSRRLAHIYKQQLELAMLGYNLIKEIEAEGL
jgi:hypothetical protein